MVKKKLVKRLAVYDADSHILKCRKCGFVWLPMSGGGRSTSESWECPQGCGKGLTQYETPTQYAERHGITRQAVHKQIEAGNLDCLEMGGKYYIPFKEKKGKYVF